VCSATGAFVEIVGDLPAALAVQRPGTEGTNTAVVLGNRAFLKVYRRLQEGINPELEVGRFLTEVSPGSRIVPVAGAVEYLDAAGTSTTLALLQAYVENQGDGWSYTLAYLSRFLEQCCAEPPEDAESVHAPYLRMMRTLGRRTAELHRALAVPTGDPAFDPEPIGAGEPAAWAEQIRSDVLATFARLAEQRERLAPELRTDVDLLLDARDALRESVQASPPLGVSLAKTRHHGDFHLGQVLVTEGDFVIVDFEGEPARSPVARRQKASPLRDVAGLLRSLSYAAHTAHRELAEKLRGPTAGRAHSGQDRLLVQDWEQQSAAAFLDGYREAATGCPSYPDDPEQAARLIDLFVLEKSLYEVRYELDNRPDWVGIPIAALMERLRGCEEIVASSPERTESRSERRDLSSG
jgi:maltose alpha-D-glucosyltransferase/alpha-amylase